jgi:pyrimidine-nucleoside phosphorylase
MDVKVGSGAFMPNLPAAEALAKQLKLTGEGCGQKVSIVFTNMNAPLGEMVGNSLEIIETIEYLKGKELPDIDIITRALVIQMLLLTGTYKTEAEADKAITRVIKDGSAMHHFREWIRLQGGDVRIIEDYSLLPSAKVQVPVIAQASGYLKGVDSMRLGYALVSIGANRRLPGDKLDYGVGAKLTKKIGDKIQKGDLIGHIYAQTEAAGKEVAHTVADCYHIVPEHVDPEPPVIQVWSGVK